jgi:RimJ/RimL family protein N-acetyltransferase
VSPAAPAPGCEDLRPLFAGHRSLRSIVEAVLAGRQGRAVRDGAAARLSLGCYEMLGGDAASPGARRLVETAARPRELVYGNDASWRRLIQDVHGNAVHDRPMRDFDPAPLDRTRLRELEAAPAGFEVVRLDGSLAGQLDHELEPHALQVFASADAFVREGIGFGAVIDGRLAAAATSYAWTPRLLEVAIGTRPAYRGRGLAAAAAAALLGHCLDAGIAPCWIASNPVSQRLAARLGFRPTDVCEVLYLG